MNQNINSNHNGPPLRSAPLNEKNENIVPLSIPAQEYANKTLLGKNPKNLFSRQKSNLVPRKFPLSKPSTVEEAFSRAEGYETLILKYALMAQFAPASRDYMAQVQTSLLPEMRRVLVEWIAQVQRQLKLSAETLFLATAYLDRVLSVRKICRRRLQLLGATCLLISGKVEEVVPPSMKSVVFLCDGACTQREMREMENVHF